MLVFETRMHIVTFLIIIFEMLFFFYQIVYYLSRPSDKKRLYYLILLYLLIQYNLVSGLFPDPKYSLSITAQNIVLFGAGYVMGMYFPYYFYKAFNLTKMKFYAYWGSFLFLFLPFVFFFLIPYYITGDLELCKKFILIVAFLYALSFIYSLSFAIKKQPHEEKVLAPKNEIISVYIGSFFWISLPIISYFEVKTNAFFEPIFNFNDTSQVIEMITTNAGLVMMTILFIRQSIRQSRMEYEKLLDSEGQLHEMNLQLQRSNDELLLKVQERTRELEMVNEQRTNTFINLAHDVKTPLMLINNYLNDYIKEVPSNESLNIIQQNIEKLNTNIINFFDSEKIKRGVTIYNHDEISELSKILKDNLLLFQQYAAKKDIEIRSEVQDELFVKADSVALSRLVNNIIENAVKYTPEKGRIFIRLTGNANVLELSVKDTGIGIPEKHLEKVFDAYFQVNKEKTNFQGMGVGLAIVKQIVDELKGSIKVISNPEIDSGTEIIIALEKCHESHLYDVMATTERIYHEFSGNVFNETLQTLLIVEDDVSLLKLMTSKLNEKYNLYIAASGNEALEKLKSIRNLNLIISDVMMDNGDGFQLYEQITKQKRFKHIPFIFITAKTEDRRKGLELGAVDYISKPFLVDDLAFKIDALLNNISEQIGAFSNAFHQSIVGRIRVETENVTAATQDIVEKSALKYNLTSQERKIVPLVIKGLTNKEIAEKLFISDKTVKSHLQNIFEKVGVTSKLELIHKFGDFN